MNTPPTQEELDQIKTIVGQITSAVLTAAAPHILQLIAAAKPADPFAGMEAGTITTLEPFEPIGLRDYRKQLWVGVYLQTLGDPAFGDGPAAVAAEAMARYDEAFPK